MENGIEIKTREDVLKIDIMAYLAKLGFRPGRPRRNEYPYYSPFRSENKPSFYVNPVKNVWYDFGLPGGGDIFAFAKIYHGCTENEFIESLKQKIILPEDIHVPSRYPEQPEPEFIVHQVKAFSDPELIAYIHERRISMQVAEHFCREVHYSLDGIPHLGIGMRNDEGGWEIRSRDYKGVVLPKMITTIDNGANEVSVFEGMFDLLSYHMLYPENALRTENYCVLHGSAWFYRSLSFLNRHHRCFVYANNDDAGSGIARCALLELDDKYRDMRPLYKSYNDLNDKLRNQPIAQTRTIRRSL